MWNRIIYTLLFSAILLSLFSACKKDSADVLTPAEVLEANDWVTSKITNTTTNQVVPNADPIAAGYVGYAYYDKDGKFAIFSLADVLRLSGTWAVPLDGKTRTLIFLNATGATQVRTVEIRALTRDVFTYRITDANGTFDVEHIPTNHTRP